MGLVFRHCWEFQPIQDIGGVGCGGGGTRWLLVIHGGGVVPPHPVYLPRVPALQPCSSLLRVGIVTLSVVCLVFVSFWVLRALDSCDSMSCQHRCLCTGQISLYTYVSIRMCIRIDTYSIGCVFNLIYTYVCMRLVTTDTLPCHRVHLIVSCCLYVHTFVLK